MHFRENSRTNFRNFRYFRQFSLRNVCEKGKNFSENAKIKIFDSTLANAKGHMWKKRAYRLYPVPLWPVSLGCRGAKDKIFYLYSEDQFFQNHILEKDDRKIFKLVSSSYEKSYAYTSPICLFNTLFSCHCPFTELF
jgi:hypothetical protein